MNGLMGELYGAERFIGQGGDWGNAIAAWMAHDRPDTLLGIHLNMVNLHAEDAAPTSDAEKAFVAKRDELLELESGYSHLQGTRPQTLAVVMADSPVVAAVWMLEKIGNWADLPVAPMAARTSGASSTKKSCSPTSCSTSRRPRSPPRPGSIGQAPLVLSSGQSELQTGLGAWGNVSSFSLFERRLIIPESRVAYSTVMPQCWIGLLKLELVAALLVACLLSSLDQRPIPASKEPAEQASNPPPLICLPVFAASDARFITHRAGQLASFCAAMVEKKCFTFVKK